MGKNSGCEQETLINELNQGYELTKQLKRHIEPLASPESCEFLIQKIISTYDKALSMLNFGYLVGEFDHQVPPRSEDSEPKDQCHKDVCKKRKTSQRWSEQVRVRSETGGGFLDDGYNWRKYGQKDILGANFPRAYYRCTHRHAQGCLATKQVQKSDKDPSILEITYRGRHTCIQTPSGYELAKQKKSNFLDGENQSQLVFNSGTTLDLKNEEDTGDVFPSFSFGSKPTESENVETFFFPETSEPNLLSLLQFPIDNFEFGENLQHSESGLSEIISAPTSVTNSPTGNLGFFLFDQLDFDPNSSSEFDISKFFC